MLSVSLELSLETEIFIALQLKNIKSCQLLEYIIITTMHSETQKHNYDARKIQHTKT